MISTWPASLEDLRSTSGHRSRHPQRNVDLPVGRGVWWRVDSDSLASTEDVLRRGREDGRHQRRRDA